MEQNTVVAQEEGEAPDPTIVAVMARMDLQGRELGRMQERVEGLLKTNRATNEENQVLKLAIVQREQDVATVTREFMGANQRERAALERAEIVERDNKQLRTENARLSELARLL